MLDRARKTVLAIINKENRGYISPSQSDLFFNQAQLEIFESYFLEYSKWVTKANARVSHSGYGDMPKHIREKIDIFSKVGTLTYVSGTTLFDFPVDTYYMEELFYTTREIVEVDKKKMKYLRRSNLTAPTEQYPVYTTYGRSVEILPKTILTNVTCDYLRKPLAPKWTYVNVSGNPIFNPSATDYQDLEIHPSDEPTIIMKVLGYVGISIREADILKILNNQDMIDLQKEKI